MGHRWPAEPSLARKRSTWFAQPCHKVSASAAADDAAATAHLGETQGPDCGPALFTQPAMLGVARRSVSAIRRQHVVAASATRAASTKSLVARGDEEHGVYYLTLNRPRQRNALSIDLLDSLRQELEKLKADGCHQFRTVVIQGEGPVFCSGHDLKEMMSEENSNEARRRELFTLCSHVMQLVETVPQPVIAAVHGIATAAGCQLVAAADMVCAAPTTRFATPGVSIGLFCSTPAVSLVRAVGRKAAMDMLLTGRLVDATEAQAIGLVSRLSKSMSDADLDREQVQSEARALATEIAAHSGSALAIGKRTFNKQISLSLDQAYDVASDAMTRNMETLDAQEGIDAFLSKRKPTWRHD